LSTGLLLGKHMAWLKHLQELHSQNGTTTRWGVLDHLFLVPTLRYADIPSTKNQRGVFSKPCIITEIALIYLTVVNYYNLIFVHN